MPNKAIAHSILKACHTGDNNPVTKFYQKNQNKELLLVKKGRGINVGSLIDFNANSGYNYKKQTEGDAPIDIKKPDNRRTYIPAPKGHNEQKPLHLFRENGQRNDAEIVQN